MDWGRLDQNAVNFAAPLAKPAQFREQDGHQNECHGSKTILFLTSNVTNALIDLQTVFV
jgi:hypothetical protein